jgi:hypothetical protein
MTNQSNQPHGHLTPREISRFVDGRLSAAETHHVEEHLAICSPCRAEIVEVGRLIRMRARRRRLLVLTPVAAAVAAAAGILLFAPRSGEPLGNGRAFRALGEGIQRVEVVAPTNDSTVSTDSVRFTWRSAGADVQYALAVTDLNGEPVFSESTSDTTLVLSVVGNLPSGRTYFWFVDALFTDGESATTGIHRFSIPQ